jgi:exonuclease VII large subunit
MRSRLVTRLGVAAILLSAAAVFAHHADTNFDRSKTITLKGTVTEFKYVNPHPHIYFQVKDENGNVADWIAETGAPPARMYNSGWKANALKPGDEVVVTGNPDKEGRKLIRLRKVSGPNGQSFNDGTP